MQRQEESGFTLIELVITAVLMSITFLSIYSLFDTLRVVNARANNLTLATQVAQKQLELRRNIPYNALDTGTTDISSALTPYPSLGPGRTGSIEVTETDTRGLKRVNVNIDYTDRGLTKRIRLSTYVARNGMNR